MDLIKNRKRYLTFLLGFFGFVFPFAGVTRLVFFLTRNPDLPDIHSACLRMPINWLFEGRLFFAALRNPLYLLFAVLMVIAFFFGPLWCGWLCPTGAFTEVLSRFVPKRIQIKPHRDSSFSPTPIRYGFLAGFLLAPFLHLGSVCCGYCDFSQFQRLVGNVFGMASSHYYGYGWAYSVTGFVTLVVWLFVFGIFTKGGRGWCSFACPVGAVQSLMHRIGSTRRYTRKIVYEPGKCKDTCRLCVDACPMWARARTEGGVETNRHACIVCQECVKTCPNGALSYAKGAEGVDTGPVRTSLGCGEREEAEAI